MVRLLPDVAFDHAAAVAAAEALRGLADALDGAGEGRAIAHTGLREWSGVARRHFDDEHAASQGTLGELAVRVRAAAGRVEDGRVAARDTQRHVDRVNAERRAAARREAELRASQDLAGGPR